MSEEFCYCGSPVEKYITQDDKKYGFCSVCFYWYERNENGEVVNCITKEHIDEE
jgi:hypothetical protein